MTRLIVVIAVLLTVLPQAGLAQQAAPARPRDENVLYNQGQRALNAERWDQALDLFTRMAALRGPRQQAALYWMGYTRNRLGQRVEALQILDRLLQAFPNGPFAVQARALQVEIRGDAGDPMNPDGEANEDLRVIALQRLQRSDPERAAMGLRRLLLSTAVPRVKNRALFLAAQNGAPGAQQILADVARGTLSPELQDRAVDYLAARRAPEARRVLADLYVSASEIRVKRRIVRALNRADDAESLVALARQEGNPDRRREIVQSLSLMRNKVALDYLSSLRQ